MPICRMENTVTVTCPTTDSPAKQWNEGWPQTPQEFEMLIDVFQDRLVRYAFRRLGNLQDAEDAIQKVFVRAYDGRAKKKRVSNVGTYLYKMAANACIDVLRQRKRRQETQLDDFVSNTTPAIEDNAGDNIAAQEERQRIESLLCHIPNRQAEILRFRVFDELRFAEIAEIIGCSEATVKSRFRYGIDKIRQKILRLQEDTL